MNELLPWVHGAWMAMLGFWLLAAVLSKRTIRTQPRGNEIGQSALAASGFVILFIREVSLGPLDWRLVPASVATAYAGLAITFVGVGFATWSRIVLGRNWSATVTLKADHELVCSGPYRIVRHPLYAGLLLAMFGTALFFGDIRSFVGVLLTFSAWRLKYRTEEKFMVDQFGAQYIEYQNRVKALIPYVL